MHAPEQDCEEIAQARVNWRNHQAKIPTAKLVFIDETSATTHMSRRYGQYAENRRLIDKAPHGHWKTTTFVAALHNTSLTAPMVSMDRSTGTVSVPGSNSSFCLLWAPSDVVVMDNLSAHKVTGIQ
jgi:hypothetical protein